MWGWFDAREAKAFGEDTARKFMARVPLDKRWTDKQFAAKSRHAMQALEVDLTEFRRERSLNTYKIAQMGNQFKWTLVEAGYDRSYVDDLTHWLVRTVS